MRTSGLFGIEGNKSNLLGRFGVSNGEVVLRRMWVGKHGICNDRTFVFAHALPILETVSIDVSPWIVSSGRDELRLVTLCVPIHVRFQPEIVCAIVRAGPFSRLGLHPSLVVVNNIVSESEAV